MSESAFAERVRIDLALALIPGSGIGPMSYCTHTRLAVEAEDLDGVVLFAAQLLAACPACARDIRDEIEAGHKRVCQRCDTSRATGLDRIEHDGILIAVQLCDICAAAEGLRSIERSRS
ncbi:MULTISPECIES: hypothetical protein [unclassified Microbacterium]|uniref:hypothetical protein n=1 Tax=unclassified Microbacterium TaxID=2609290 RepID=UPI0024695B65|nr:MULTISPECIES: hypothetical protein [unclassified Microbacterium]MDH5134620.1 hypothetical protein [Microbacterium sp. RD10]MDH5138174.1 hypothetical protein [Microbacterium sp. RD11]MDH5146106.1 hypothetical protein [Microbacterium sp. RD12]MDH5156155.1 hypothetical protein [Microbacterium sp. RD06]MDH5168101.1 hypothetical protein [Microbacterium sp. RD02]